MKRMRVVVGVVALALCAGCEQPAGVAAKMPERAAAPAASPGAGAVGAGTRVSLSTTTEGAEIYYTTDGNAPDSTGMLYSEAVLISEALTIRAVAVKEGVANSGELKAGYVIDPDVVAAPVADPPAGGVVFETELTLSSATDGAEIYYTIDGNVPDSTKTKYTRAIIIDMPMTVKAVAVKEGLKESALLEAVYSVVEPDRVAAPSAFPAAGEVDSGSAVALSSATKGAEIYYTTDGSVPDRSKMKYTGPVGITDAVTIRAIAVKEGMEDSDALEAAYTVVAPGTAAMPSASPAAGAVFAGTMVTLSSTTPEAEIYYTTDGSVPDRSKTKYTGPVSITVAVTIRAIAVKEGRADSAVLETAYTIAAPLPARAARPVASPAAGEVPYGMGVSLSTTTPGAAIYYTTDGSVPDRSQIHYTGAILIDAPVTIRAMAVKEGMTDSDVLTAVYTIAPSQQPEEPEIPVVVRLEIASLPDITYYALGQAFDPAGLRVNEVYSDGAVKELFSYTVDQANTARPGQKVVYVRSGTFSASFSVYVDSSTVVLQNMVFKRGPTKTVYELGENFSKTGILFTAFYSDGSQKDLDGAACSFAGYDRTKRGVQQVTLKVNSFSQVVDVTVRVPASAAVYLNTATGGIIRNEHYRHVRIKGMPLDLDNLNLEATVSANGVSTLMKGGKDFTGGEINLTGYNAYAPGRQTLSFDLDDKKGISFWVYVADVEPAVWFDYGYQRSALDPDGAGAGAGKYYARPGETLVLAPVRYLVGYNGDNSPGYVSYNWSVSGGSCTGVPSASGETYSFTPAAEGSYTVRVQVTGRDFVSGGTTTKSAVTEVVCYTGTVNTGQTFVSPLFCKAPGQFVYGNPPPGSTPITYGGPTWSLGTFGGYEVWAVEPQESYQIRGNPFSGWSEAGVVWMQEDRNNNGVPDEMWHELIGGLEGQLVTRRYAIAYMPTEPVYAPVFIDYAWVDCKGRSGIIGGGANIVTGTFTGTLLEDNGKIMGSTLGPGSWGYVDSLSSIAHHHPGWEWDRFFVSDAVKADGSPADLDAVRFIKVHTGFFKYGDVFGENSTEIRVADFLPDQADGFPDPVEYE